MRNRTLIWLLLGGGAFVLVAVTLLALVTREFKLGLDERLADLTQETDAHLQRHMKAISTAVERSKKLSR